eukprot:3838867-Pyramimonas_sp.AAC.1
MVVTRCLDLCSTAENSFTTCFAFVSTNFGVAAFAFDFAFAFPFACPFPSLPLPLLALDPELGDDGFGGAAAPAPVGR